MSEDEEEEELEEELEELHEEKHEDIDLSVNCNETGPAFCRWESSGRKSDFGPLFDPYSGRQAEQVSDLFEIIAPHSHT